MITTLIVNLISVLLSIVSVVLPAWRLPDYIIDSFRGAIDILLVFNFALPVNAAIKSFIIILTFESTILFARLVLSLITIIRGGGKIEV